MAKDSSTTYDYVGPVLQAGALTNAIIAAIRELNSDVVVINRGAYLRVLVPKKCFVTRERIENHLGRPVRFPGELEMVMSGFKGTISLTPDQATWEFKKRD